MKRKIELLAPAKDFEHGKSALLCGADALYVGAPSFGARAAAGVPTGQIADLCDLAHGFGAKVYVAMNTLLYDSELKDAERIACQMWEAGADALIIQDHSFLRMSLPPIELHASTQTYNTDPERVQFLSQVGFSRAILERALSLDQIEAIHKQYDDIELEAFVHGAICVGYSGRCYLSRTMSSRSGNRGDCSQACRLKYNLLDENQKVLIKDKHLLSVQDLNLSEYLEDMIDVGVSSFKIEGRLKDMNYVKNVVSWYRRSIDEILERRQDTLERSSRGVSTIDFTPQPEKSFSRGFTTYFIDNEHNHVCSFDSPKSIGESVGEVTRLGANSFEILWSDDATLSNADGICFLDHNGELRGTNINRVEGRTITPNNLDGIRVGMEIFRNYDHRFSLALERSKLKRVIDLNAVMAVTPTSATLTICDPESGTTAVTTINGVFDSAKNPEAARKNIIDQLSKSGDSIYRISGVDIEWDSERFMPISVLNQLRREALDKFHAVCMESYDRPERGAENKTIQFPEKVLGGSENITNRLAEKFYRDHGVETIETAFDMREELIHEHVLQSHYCIRRELGECLRENPKLKGDLYIENGLHQYKLTFDCKNCQMSLLYCGKRTHRGY